MAEDQGATSTPEILSPINLVQTKSANAFDLGKNHQVLVYGYELINNELTLKIYDPNHPNDDGVTISLNIGDPQHTIDVRRSHADPQIFCFFHIAYTHVPPPADWESLGGVSTSGAAACSWAPGRLDVFVQGHRQRRVAPMVRRELVGLGIARRHHHVGSRRGVVG